MSFETWQIAVGVAGLALASAGPTLLWFAYVRADGRWQGRLEGKLDELHALLANHRLEHERTLASAQREHDQIREIALSAHRKADRLIERLGSEA